MWGQLGEQTGEQKKGKQGNIHEELTGEGNKLGAIHEDNQAKIVEQAQGTKPTGRTKPTRSTTKVQPGLKNGSKRGRNTTGDQAREQAEYKQERFNREGGTGEQTG